MKEPEAGAPASSTTCPNGHMSVVQKTDGTFYCMDCSATWA